MGGRAIEQQHILECIQQALDDKKGGDLIVLDVRSLSYITDFFVIVTGNNPPHLKALTEHVAFVTKANGFRAKGRSGTPESGWIVLDFVDVVVHVCSPETRAYYALEELWSDARPIDLRNGTADSGIADDDNYVESTANKS